LKIFSCLVMLLVTANGWAAAPALARTAPAATKETRQVPLQTVLPAPGTCLSYWGNNGKNWATILLRTDQVTRLAAAGDTRAQRLLANLAAKPDGWGCRHIQDTQGAPLGLVFDLLQAGTVTVIDDASGTPVPQLWQRFSGPQQRYTSFHLAQGLDAFLTRDTERLTQDEADFEPRLQRRAHWGIETTPLTANNQAALQFAKDFLASCMSQDKAGKAFARAHIQLPLQYRFNMVDDNGAHGNMAQLERLANDSETGGVGLPLCVGDGGLDDVVFSQERHNIVLGLQFGSGPNETLHFSAVRGQWLLTSAEWFDH
jgi:hypothetical protein